MEELNLKTKKVWDLWRQKYDILTTQDQKEFYDAIEKEYPDQAHFNVGKILFALTMVLPDRIVEIGGWKGDLAKLVLDHTVLFGEWVNIELCPAAIAGTVCKDPRYKVIEPATFDWFTDPPVNFKDGSVDMVIATHFIEHISDMHFRQLLKSIRGVPFIYFEAPLSTFKNHWNGYIGTHKLSMGWSQVEAEMLVSGYDIHAKAEISGDCRLFKLRR